MPITMILMSFIAPFCGALIGKTVRNPWLLTIALIINGVILALLHAVILDVFFIYDSKISIRYGLIFGLCIFFPLMVISGLLSRRITIKTQTRSKVRYDVARKTKENQVSKSSFVPDTKIQSEMSMKAKGGIMKVKGDEKFWATADQEINSEPKHDLWIKCLYASDQDESKARALYVHERVEQLKEEAVQANRSEKLELKLAKRKRSRGLFGTGFISFLLFSLFIGSWIGFLATLLDRHSPFVTTQRIETIEDIIRGRKWSTASPKEGYNWTRIGNTSVTLDNSKAWDSETGEPIAKYWIKECNFWIRHYEKSRQVGYALLALSLLGIGLFAWLTTITFSKFWRLKKEA